MFGRDFVSQASNFFVLKKSKKRIILYLNWYRKKFPKSFPRISRIAKSCGCCERTVQNFIRDNKQLGNLYFEVVSRNKNGRQTSNEYILDKNLILALEWLDCYGYLHAARNKIESIISSMQKQEKLHPSPPKNCTPLSRDSSFSGDEDSERTESVNHLLKDIKIDLQSKKFASRASTREIYETLQSCQWRSNMRKMGKISNPSAYFMRILKNNMQKFRGL